MTPREISALVSTILVIVGTTWYIHLALKGIKVKPVLATWIVLTVTMTLSFVSYLASPNPSIVNNACNGISIFSTAAILITAIRFNRQEGKGVNFNLFQKRSLMLSGWILIVWFVIILIWGFKGSGIVPNILTQVLMLIGYAVNAERLWRAPRNTDSLFLWWCILGASGTALYSGVITHDPLVILYGSRATFGTLVLVILMYRVELRRSTTYCVT